VFEEVGRGLSLEGGHEGAVSPQLPLPPASDLITPLATSRRRPLHDHGRRLGAAVPSGYHGPKSVDE